MLKSLEEKFSQKKAFLVIGVHSAKFENEKITSHIEDAIEKYDIRHPVINDADAVLWTQMNIVCWPTVLLFGPGNQLFFCLIGENNVADWLHLYTTVLYEFFEQKDYLSKNLKPILKGRKFKQREALHFPSKINASPKKVFIAISDSGNDRVVIISSDGCVKHLIGGRESGYKDGDFSEAAFNNPQGVVWLSEDTLFVADTNNHCIRKIDLILLRVETIAANSDENSEESCKIVSPWDLCLVGEDKLFIALAGSHQIAALCLRDSCLILDKSLTSRNCVVLAGNGREENRNNNYAHKAGFSQPSGLAYCQKFDCLFIADSESSSIRKLNLQTGSVTNTVGGSRDPLDLFAFGDRDAIGFDARLQHPLGLAFNDFTQKLLIADSYNHKIKVVDIETRRCDTIAGTGVSANIFNCDLLSAAFNEPNGLCMLEEGKVALVADTNNHCIKKIDFNENRVSVFNLLFANDSREESINSEAANNDVIELRQHQVSNQSVINVQINLQFQEHISLTQNAPHSVLTTLSANIAANKKEIMHVGKHKRIREIYNENR
ncbi:NHL repeat-containing protein 2-like protein [Dinothrombium tinctorium]|uniref:NHL repeat-containing protein 2-like protein n=1 Tax=Dinothrombium tinctorium TaxID=1965070 RepID=A0A443RGF2_9ACAR|nr:NHL repeat-containing protein 2-like protein [Dinothrombium tinctorium]